MISLTKNVSLFHFTLEVFLYIMLQVRNHIPLTSKSINGSDPLQDIHEKKKKERKIILNLHPSKS